MLNFYPPFLCRVLSAILKIADILKIFKFPIGFYSNPHPQKYDFDPLYHQSENFRINLKHISITPPSFMKFCPVVPEICRGQVHSAWKERRITRTRTRITRYDYNLTIMKSPKPATDTIYPHFKF